MDGWMEGGMDGHGMDERNGGMINEGLDAISHFPPGNQPLHIPPSLKISNIITR